MAPFLTFFSIHITIVFSGLSDISPMISRIYSTKPDQLAFYSQILPLTGSAPTAEV